MYSDYIVTLIRHLSIRVSHPEVKVTSKPIGFQVLELLKVAATAYHTHLVISHQKTAFIQLFRPLLKPSNMG